MRNFYSILILLIFFSRFTAQETLEHQSLIESELSSYQKKSDFNVNPNTLNYDLQYQRMEVSLDPAVTYISGSVTSHFLSKESMSAIYFDFTNQIPVSEVTYHGLSLAFQQLSTKELKIDFPNSIPNNTLDSLTVHYSGVPDNIGRTYFYVGQQNGSPVLSTLSEPYGAQNWFPTKQSMNDKIDRFDFKITTPDQYSVAANGLLKSETLLSGNRKLTFWRTQYPMAAYLAGLSIGDFVKFNDTIGNESFPYVNYLYSDTSTNPAVLDNLEWTKEAMAILETHFGPYPFANEKYGHMQFAVSGVGMEHQTMSSMDSFGKAGIVHELSHQWFGDKITCGSWNDAWLNEGFAIFSEYVVYEKNMMTPTEFLNHLQFHLNSITSLPGGSVYIKDSNLGDISTIFNGRLTYQKGGFVLRMLQWILGDDEFFQMMRDYASNPNFAYKYATTENFKNQIHTSTGKDFTDFFNDWVYGEGYPSYVIKWNQPIANQEINFLISQTQSHSSVNFFEMPLPIKITGTNGEVLNLVLNNTQNNQRFSEMINFKVASVSFNDELRIIEKNSTVNFDPSLLKTNSSQKQEVLLFPNPVKNEINFKGILTQTSYEIYSVDGRLITKGNYNPGTLIKVSNLKIGIYFIKINDQIIKFQKD
ncbi:MAG: T9SS type A sorting domain-containing protein [Flavobacteriales bacterium]|nr:T9SS type A sorting domain-containing protein [Flavobacteriales bacterium]